MLNIARQAFDFRICASARITPEGNSPKNSENIVLFQLVVDSKQHKCFVKKAYIIAYDTMDELIYITFLAISFIIFKLYSTNPSIAYYARNIAFLNY